jgi:hypothetical protein
MGKESYGVESLSEMHPVIEKLEAAASDESVVPLEGFIGRSSETALRLHRRLDLNDYWEIPRDCIVEVMEIPDDKEGRRRLLVKGSCRITVVSVNRSVMTADRLGEPFQVALMRPLPPGTTPPFKAELRRMIMCANALALWDMGWSQVGEAMALPFDKAVEFFGALSKVGDLVNQYCNPPG